MYRTMIIGSWVRFPDQTKSISKFKNSKWLVITNHQPAFAKRSDFPISYHCSGDMNSTMVFALRWDRLITLLSCMFINCLITITVRKQTAACQLSRDTYLFCFLGLDTSTSKKCENKQYENEDQNIMHTQCTSPSIIEDIRQPFCTGLLILNWYLNCILTLRFDKSNYSHCFRWK